MDVSPQTWYRRTLEGGDFSLEANTQTVPEQGRFYLLCRGRVLFTSRCFPPALEAYLKQCRQFWETRLTSSNGRMRLRAALGLIELDPLHSNAAEVIRQDGGNAALERLATLRRRYQSLQRKLRLEQRRGRSAAGPGTLSKARK